VRTCSIHGCYQRAYARGWCLDHYVAHTGLSRALVVTIRHAKGTTLEVARRHGVSAGRVWEIRSGRWWGFL
jgi:hypothetical protein